MLTRQLVTVVTIALTLLCPYLPCGECCAACDPETTAEIPVEDSKVHSCCGTCESRHPEEAPVDRECPVGGKLLNCFCGGAVVPSSVDCPDADHSGFHPLWLDIDALRPLYQLRQTTQATHFGSHFPPLAMGRDIRNLVVSYLL